MEIVRTFPLPDAWLFTFEIKINIYTKVLLSFTCNGEHNFSTIRIYVNNVIWKKYDLNSILVAFPYTVPKIYNDQTDCCIYMFWKINIIKV